MSIISDTLKDKGTWSTKKLTMFVSFVAFLVTGLYLVYRSPAELGTEIFYGFGAMATGMGVLRAWKQTKENDKNTAPS